MSALLLAVIAAAAGASPGSPPEPPEPTPDASFPAASYNLFQYSVTGATAGVVLGSDRGFYTLEQDQSIFDPAVFGGYWTSGANPVSDFEARATVTSGSLSYGDPGGVWLNLGTARSWGVSASGVVTVETVEFTLEIRDAATLTVLATTYVSAMIEVGT